MADGYAEPDDAQKVPKPVEERIKRGRERMKDGAGKRNECLEFSRSNQYRWVNSKGALKSQATTTDYIGRGGKPPHRVRTTRNLIFDIVEHEVSAATQRVPSYDVSPSTTDPEDIGAARLGEKVALYGYDKWGVRAATERVVRYAVVADEGFAWPYFDNTVGPFIDDPTTGKKIGQGEIKIRVFGPNQVFWEPGITFNDSRWFGIEEARDPKDAMEMDGYSGGDLKADATAADKSDRSVDISQAKLVMVCDYFERPSPANPLGRWLTISNGRQICAEKPYPCTTPDGQTLDEPILHKLAYAKDPDSDRDMGLVRHLLDSQRTINASVNKMTEWVNLALNPQVIIQNGEFKQRLTDEPGQVYHAVGTGQIAWRPVPQLPQELFQMKSQAESDMARIAAQNDIPSGVEAGRAITALIEKDANRRQNFIANLAEFHSRLMKHMLYLVQKHYTEERLIKIGGGHSAPDLIPDFVGTDLRGQADVSVLPGSIEPRTKQAVEQKVMNFAQLGWVSPEAAMTAINSGTGENLIESHELDKGRAYQTIQKIKDGSFLNDPPRSVFPGEMVPPDPMTGMVPATVPGWMPRKGIDNLRVHKQIFGDFMKTIDFDLLDDPGKEATMLYWDTLLQLEVQEAQREQMIQAQQAEEMGMQNAARPPQNGDKPNPSLPSMPGPDQGNKQPH